MLRARITEDDPGSFSYFTKSVGRSVKFPSYNRIDRVVEVMVK